MAKTRFFRVAVEGATTDGRHIERAWIEQAARNYSTGKYTATVNLEHIKGVLPGGSAGSPFGAYGTVTALKAEEISEGPLKGKLALYAQVEATDDLVKLNKEGQKIFPSCEINPAFAGSNEAYLVGLAITDDPASLGTERFQFSAKSSANTFAKRKQDAGNVLTATTDDLGLTLELEPETPATESFAAQITAGIKDAFASILKPPAPPAPAPATPPAPADPNAAVFAALESGFEKMAGGLEKVFAAQASEVARLSSQVQDLATKLAATAAPGQGREPATGGTGAVTTDC